MINSLMRWLPTNNLKQRVEADSELQLQLILNAQSDPWLMNKETHSSKGILIGRKETIYAQRFAKFAICI